MKIIYECEKLAILEENDKFIIHILDDYRLVKEVVTNRCNLISTLMIEFNQPKSKEKKRKINKKKTTNPLYLSAEINDINQILNYR